MVNLAEGRIRTFERIIRAHRFGAHEEGPGEHGSRFDTILLGQPVRMNMGQEPRQDKGHRAGNAQPIEFGKLD